MRGEGSLIKTINQQYLQKRCPKALSEKETQLSEQTGCRGMILKGLQFREETRKTLAEVLQNEKAFSKIQSTDLSLIPLPGDVKAGRCATGE